MSNAGRFAFVEFCDDVRHEIGNKYSLMGCYGSELILSDIPAILPKLCVLVRAGTPLDHLFERLIFRVFSDDRLLLEANAELEKLNKEQLSDVSPLATRGIANAFFEMSPFAVPDEMTLRVEAETEEGVLIAGILRVRKAQRTAETGGLKI